MYMRNEYDYYISIIKPIEKKYNRHCILYSIFKFKYFYTMQNFYNKILISYYKRIQNNEERLNNLQRELMKK